jgi:hypothetical protein
MNGRERIRAAFEHGRVDRVPRFDQTIYSNVASVVLGREVLVGGAGFRFMDVKMRWESAGAATEFEERMLRDVAGFYRELDYDMARVPWRDTRRAVDRLDENTFFFGDLKRKNPWEIWRYSPESQDWHPVDGWLAGGDVDRLIAHLESEERSCNGPDLDPGRMDIQRRFRELVGPERAVAATVGGIGIPMYEAAWLMAIQISPELVAAELERQTLQGLADIELAAHLGVDVAHAGGDFCLNSGPVFSPETFDRLVLPRLQRLAAKCREVGIKYVFRTDGVTWPVADSLWGRSGVHAAGEIDFGAGMRLAELRRSFPSLTLFGNIDCGGVILTGGQEDIRRATRDNLAETGGIGHIFGASNEIMPETPVENYLAMLDESDRFNLFE